MMFFFTVPDLNFDKCMISARSKTHLHFRNYLTSREVPQNLLSQYQFFFLIFLVIIFTATIDVNLFSTANVALNKQFSGQPVKSS